MSVSVRRDHRQKIGLWLVALGKLARADGLVFLNKVPAGFEVRFTAVDLGYALFDDQLAAPRNPEQAARSLAHRVAGYAPKLRLDPAQVTPRRCSTCARTTPRRSPPSWNAT